MTTMSKLMGDTEHPHVQTPAGSGATPSQKTNAGGDLEETMKNIAGKYTNAKGKK